MTNSLYKPFKWIAGAACYSMLADLTQNLGSQPLLVERKEFMDGEKRVRIHGILKNDNIAICQSIPRPATEHLMELLMLIDAAKNAGASEVSAIIPYFGYGRQDRAFQSGECVSARLVSHLLEAAGADRVFTIDLHSEHTVHFFDTATVHHIDPLPVFLPHLSALQDAVVIAPDVGGALRAKKVAHILNAPLVTLKKKRMADQKCEISFLDQNTVAEKKCIIIDDIVDTAETLCATADFLKSTGAAEVYAFITHPVLSYKAIELVESHPLNHLFVLDTVPHPWDNLNSSKIHVIRSAPLIRDAFLNRTPF